MDLPSAPSNAPGDMSNKSKLGEPSKARRESLKKHNEKAPIALQNLCPISKYYAAADIVLEQFKELLKNGDLDGAYIIGRRFALFSTVSLPGHDYYTSPNPDLVKLRLKNQKDAQWVTTGIERIVQVMDKQEIDKQNAELERIRKQKEEEEREKIEWELNMKQRLTAVELSTDSERFSAESDGDGKDLLSRLASLNALFPREVADKEEPIPSAPPHDFIEQNEKLPPLPPPIPLPLIDELESSALVTSTSAVDQLKSNGKTPMFEEPPSYSDLFLDVLRTSSVSNSTELRPSTASSIPSSIGKQPRISIRTIQQTCSQQLQSCIDTKQIEFIRLGTYQGRLASSSAKYDSTNGCAVISPLVVATHIYPQHVHKEQPTSKYGISNVAINEIIDRRAPPILNAVRTKLGLSKHALIIPSDVHDYLVDEHILPQDKFVGACGGDILDHGHLNELVEMMVNGHEASKKNKSAWKLKVGAALFFREHVVSIIKVPLANGECYFDLIDSLPSSRVGGMASRTRCKDKSSFESLLRWYASSKFSDSQCEFIDKNKWDDGMCDFDPRVFQSFVWTETQ
ncbi:hypothetical protein ACHAXM_004055 [Skeletonema potamos]|jgi:hypothetical protein